MSNLYYNPEEFGLEIVDELEDPQADYSFNKIVVWKHKETKKLFWASDSGCSCPSPFENYQFSGPDRTNLGSMESSRKDFELEVENHPIGMDSKAAMLALVKKLIRKTKVKPPVIKQRERIDVFRMNSSDFTYNPKPLNEFLKWISKTLEEKLKEVEVKYENTFEDIQVEFNNSIEEYIYPGDTDVPGLIFTGIRKD